MGKPAKPNVLEKKIWVVAEEMAGIGNGLKPKQPVQEETHKEILWNGRMRMGILLRKGN